MTDHTFVTLHAEDGSIAWIAPHLGGWLLRYARLLPDRGLVEALHCSQAVVDRYPREMYAGNPVLFPIVSFNHLPDQEHHYAWNQNIFPLPQHGFARRSPWSVVDQTESSVTMELLDSDQSRAVYPFSFRHRLCYRLDNGRLHWEQVIENSSSEPMPFSTGFHPYFPIPITPSGQRSSCFVEIPDCIRLTPDPKFSSFSREPFPAQNLSVQTDVSGTLFLTGFRRREWILVDPLSRLEIVLNGEDAPQHQFLALWSRNSQEPFYCIEPWTSLPNSISRADTDLVSLAPQSTFRAAFWLQIRPAG